MHAEKKTWCGHDDPILCVIQLFPLCYSIIISRASTVFPLEQAQHDFHRRILYPRSTGECAQKERAVMMTTLRH